MTTDIYQPRKGDRFEHARHLDLEWTPGPGETWAKDAPHRVYTVTCVRDGNVWFGVRAGAFSATVAQMQEGGFYVKRWLPSEGSQSA